MVKENAGAGRQQARSAYLLPPPLIAARMYSFADRPKELRVEFAQRVLASGLSTSAFITKCVFGRDPPRRSRCPSVEHEAVAQILSRLAQVRDQLHAIDAHLGEGSEADRILIEEAVRPLTEIRALCFKALGRKP